MSGPIPEAITGQYREQCLETAIRQYGITLALRCPGSTGAPFVEMIETTLSDTTSRVIRLAQRAQDEEAFGKLMQAAGWEDRARRIREKLAQVNERLSEIETEITAACDPVTMGACAWGDALAKLVGMSKSLAHFESTLGPDEGEDDSAGAGVPVGPIVPPRTRVAYQDYPEARDPHPSIPL